VLDDLQGERRQLLAALRIARRHLPAAAQGELAEPQALKPAAVAQEDLPPPGWQILELGEKGGSRPLLVLGGGEARPKGAQDAVDHSVVVALPGPPGQDAIVLLREGLARRASAQMEQDPAPRFRQRACQPLQEARFRMDSRQSGLLGSSI